VFLLQSVYTDVEGHLAEPIRVGDPADPVGFSPFHFARRFRAVAGVSPMRYVMLMRLDRARDLLRTTDLAFADLADRTGFSSAFHLSRRFSERFDESPSAFRARLKRAGQRGPRQGGRT